MKLDNKEKDAEAWQRWTKAVITQYTLKRPTNSTSFRQNSDFICSLNQITCRFANKSDSEARSLKISEKTLQPAKLEQIPKLYAQKIIKPLQPRANIQIYNVNLQIEGPHGQI